MVASFLMDGSRRPSTSTSISPPMEPPSLRASPQLTQETSLEGPPSPQGIRAYTEQMKRNVISSHGRTRTNSTVSSFSSDSGSPELKRQSSKKSMASLSMRADRPESIQIFGKSLFSRGSRKSKSATGRSSSLSLHQRESQYGAVIEEESPKKSLISGPYNFQHVVHTGPGHQNGDEVKSRGPSLDDEQALPQRPHASSISDSDYMSDATVEFPSIAEEGTPRPQRRMIRKPISPINVPRLRSSQSHDSVRNAPPRPPRSPMMAMPVSLPPRTSSRTPSMIWDEYDPLQSNSLERPHYASGFRRPQAFHLPLSPPLPADNIAQEQSDYFSPLAPAPVRQQDNVGWPFAPQPSPSENGSQSSQLADVPEEEELTTATRHSKRMSTSSIRASRSVPNMQARSRADSRVSASKIPLPPTPTAFLGFAQQMKAQQPIRLNLDSFDSWEEDIDYCYEHEVEADCDYNWERTSIDTEIARTNFHDLADYSDGGDKFDLDFNPGSSPRSMHSASVSICAQMDSLRSMPDPHAAPESPSRDFFQLPDFDFTSLSLSPTAATRKRESFRPDNLHLAAPRNDEFQESQGFTLSPSLLIPFDYAKQMDMESSADIDHHGFRFEAMHHDGFASYADRSRSSYGSDSNRLSDPHSTVSIRSSNTSHTDYDRLKGSGGSSTSLAGSFAPSSRHESVILERAAEVAQSGRASNKNSGEFGVGRSHAGSVSSTVSFSSNLFDACINEEIEERDIGGTPNAVSISNRLSDGQVGQQESVSIELARQEAESRLLPPSPSPCAQSPMEEQRTMMHGRKGSVPLLNVAQHAAPPRSGGSPKGMRRARASTVGSRGRSNYGLFPAPVATPQQPNFPVMGNAF